MRWIGMSVAVVGLFAAIGLGAGYTAFINVPSLLFVLMVGCGIVTAAHGVQSVALIWRALTDRPTLSPAQTRQAKSIATTGIQTFLAVGWIGGLVGVVQLLAVLDDPSRIGVGMATALLTPLYGAIVAFVICLPFARSLDDFQGEDTTRADSQVPLHGRSPATTN